MKDDYQKLVEFWNSNFTLTEEDKKELKNLDEEDYKKLAPSQKLYDVLGLFQECDTVLDYGCGSGWASVIMAKMGVKNITSAEVAHESLEMLKCYAKAFGVENNIHPTPIDEKWLNSQKEGVFDGFFCSNVIDVVPLEMAKDIIKNAAKVISKNSLAVFGLNYYIDPKKMEERGYIVEGRQVYINGVLRLTSLTDQEWLDTFKDYFETISLSYFAWPGEEKETRRLFVLKKK